MGCILSARVSVHNMSNVPIRLKRRTSGSQYICRAIQDPSYIIEQAWFTWMMRKKTKQPTSSLLSIEFCILCLSLSVSLSLPLSSSFSSLCPPFHLHSNFDQKWLAEEETDQDLGRRSLWPDLAKFHHFNKNLWVHLVFSKILILLWLKNYVIGPILITVNDQILKNNLPNWSHWRRLHNFTIDHSRRQCHTQILV